MASKFEVFSEKFDRGVQINVGAFACVCESWVDQGWGLGYDVWMDGGWNND